MTHVSEVVETIEVDVAEKTTPLLTFTVVDENGAPIAGASLDVCDLMVFDEISGTVLTTPASPGRDIRANIDGSGNGSVVLVEAETAIHNTTRPSEWHIAYIHWEYNAGAGDGKAKIRFFVRNFTKVT